MAKQEEPYVNPYLEEGYEPHFDRMSTTRRVLGFITDETHGGRARNTLQALTEDLADDPNSAVEHNEHDAVEEHLVELEEAGLIEQADGVYSVTEAGMVELSN